MHSEISAALPAGANPSFREVPVGKRPARRRWSECRHVGADDLNAEDDVSRRRIPEIGEFDPRHRRWEEPSPYGNYLASQPPLPQALIRLNPNSSGRLGTTSRRRRITEEKSKAEVKRRATRRLCIREGGDDRRDNREEERARGEYDALSGDVIGRTDDGV
jgi:hypothetical protein